ncbi:BglG family transcription antiterminator [Garciella nitratireducens]|uniref:BglG family transcription antiterminator n=1 Tax=Garciella nitratireducens TaxID=218205 RepID=UPI001BD5D363|nr:BglG family transcription antiterminator [Garciella nitratireducens]
MNQKIKITQRQKEILERISNYKDYITISDIAKSLKISSRTVIRELKDIEKWLKLYECSLDKKTGVGIKLKGSIKNRERVLERLEKGRYIKNYSAKERQIIIVCKLLQLKEPIKLFALAHSLHVTEGTLSHDLDKIDNWLKEYDLTLIRKPGVGIYLEGKEEQFRKTIINLIYQNSNEIQLLDLIHQKVSFKVSSKESLINFMEFIDKDTIEKLETLLFTVEKNLCRKLADNAYIGLLIHLSLAIQRIKQNQKITIGQKELEALKKYEEFKIAQKLASKIEKEFEIEVPEEEIGYITMHLRGSKYFEKEYKNEELENLAKEILHIAEVETGSFLEYDQESISFLENHLGPAINRLKMKMDIRNPLLHEIKEYYPELFDLAKKCVIPIENKFHITMPDSEIAYIAMHLGAVLGRKKLIKKFYRVVVACATGIGTSGLLATRIQEEYHNIAVVEKIPALNIQENELKNRGIDFVISTIPIELSSIPVVVVNPLFFNKDKQLVDRCIENLTNKSIERTIEKEYSNHLKERLFQNRIYTEGILQILNNFFLMEYEKFENIYQLIDTLSYKISEKEENAIQIKHDLIEREKYGGTILTGFHAILLHCRTSGVKQLFFGLIRIKKSLICSNREEKEPIELAIIMLIPENNNQFQREIMSFISSKIIEEAGLLQDLKQAQQEKVYTRLNHLLDDFYKAKILDSL